MITSINNSQIKNINLLLKKARERKAQRLFIVEGIRAVSEVPSELLSALYISSRFAKSDEGKEYIAKPQFKGVTIEEVEDSVFDKLSDTVTPQGVLAVVKMQQYELSDLLKGQAHLVILESLQDPGNLGTIIRTAEGAGATGIIMNNTTVDLYSPKVVRSTMGSLFRMPFFVTADLQDTISKLQNEGVKLYAAHLKGEKYYDEFDFTASTGFLIGNEGNGLTKETADLADSYLKIPMEGKLESLNASVAASLLMYETHRQRMRK